MKKGSFGNPEGKEEYIEEEKEEIKKEKEEDDKLWLVKKESGEEEAEKKEEGCSDSHEMKKEILKEKPEGRRMRKEKDLEKGSRSRYDAQRRKQRKGLENVREIDSDKKKK